MYTDQILKARTDGKKDIMRSFDFLRERPILIFMKTIMKRAHFDLSSFLFNLKEDCFAFSYLSKLL